MLFLNTSHFSFIFALLELQHGLCTHAGWSRTASWHTRCTEKLFFGSSWACLCWGAGRGETGWVPWTPPPPAEVGYAAACSFLPFLQHARDPHCQTDRQTPELKNGPPYSFVHFYLVDFSLTDTSICRSANQAVCHISRDVKYDHTKRGLLTKRDKREHGGTKSSPFRSLEWKTCKRFMKPNLTLPNYQVENVIKDTPNYFESLKQLPNILVKVSAKISWFFFLTILFRASFSPTFLNI